MADVLSMYFLLSFFKSFFLITIVIDSVSNNDNSIRNKITIMIIISLRMNTTVSITSIIISRKFLLFKRPPNQPFKANPITQNPFNEPYSSHCESLPLVTAN